MIKQWVFSIIIFFFIGINVHGQIEFAPNGSKWTFSYDNFPYRGIEEVIYDSDTVINGITAKKLLLIRTLVYSNQPSSDTLIELGGIRYLYQNQDEVLEYIDGMFHPIFRFSLQAGDSIQVPYNGVENVFIEHDRINVYVDSVTVLNIGNEPRKLLHVREVCQSIDESTLANYSILEGVGPIGGGYLFFNEQACFSWGAEIHFRCFQINEETIYSSVADCSILTNSAHLPLNNTKRISLFPNPAKDFVTIKHGFQSKFSLQIYNTLGQVVYSKKFDSKKQIVTIDTTQTKSGVYWAHFNFVEQKSIVLPLIIMGQ